MEWQPIDTDTSAEAVVRMAEAIDKAVSCKGTAASDMLNKLLTERDAHKARAEKAEAKNAWLEKFAKALLQGDHPAVEYIRADQAQAEKEAAVAAAYEYAAGLEFGKLGWGRAEKDGMNLQSDTPFGRYYIAARPDSVWLWWRPASGPAHHGNAASEQDAMEQCQQDYEMRLSLAVTIRTDTDALERVRQEAKAEALREAHQVVHDSEDCAEAIGAIEALIDRPAQG